MNLYQCTEPEKWKAGSIGEKPFYHDCADCDAKEPVISGFISGDPKRYESMGIIPAGGLFKLAVFCPACFEKRLAANKVAA